MELNQRPDFATALQSLLERMEACAQQLESITASEYEAIRNLDADRIMQLSDERLANHNELVLLEQAGRKLLADYNVSEQTPLSTAIEIHAGTQASGFQALRRRVQERMLKVDRHSQENRMRLHAAYNVSSAILNSLGLNQAEDGYHRGVAR